jgi:hypothetical protein
VVLTSGVTALAQLTDILSAGPRIVRTEFKRGEIMLSQGRVFQEKTTSLFQPDPVSRLQFLDNFKKTSLEPERLLMLAVLEDAITCVKKYASFKSGGNRKLFDETVDWIRMENDEWLFSFNNVCDALGLNTGRLRVALLDTVAGRFRILSLEQTHRTRPHRSSCRAYTVARKPKFPDFIKNFHCLF